MSVVNYTNGGSAANALANFARPYGITPSDRLQTEQLPMSVLANALAGNIPLEFNVMSYGAIGDGVADDSAAFAAAYADAVAGKGELYIPPGTYKVQVTFSGEAPVRGAGIRRTVLTPANTAYCVRLFGSGGDANLGATLSNLSIQGSGKVGTGLLCGDDSSFGFSNGLVERLDITGFQYNINIKSSIICTFRQIWSKDGEYGLFIDSEKNVTLLNMTSCRFTTNDYGIYLQAGIHCVFTSCNAESNNFKNLWLATSVDQGPSKVIFDGCWFEDLLAQSGTRYSVHLDMNSGIAATKAMAVEFNRCVITAPTGLIALRADYAQDVVFNRCSFNSFDSTRFSYATGTNAVRVWLRDCGTLQLAPTAAQYSSFPALTRVSGGVFGFFYEFTAPDGERVTNYETLSISSAATDLQIAYVKTLRVDTSSGNVNINSFLGGSEGQVIDIVKDSTSNFVSLVNNGTGTEKVLTRDGTSVVLSSRRGASLAFYGGSWYQTADGPRQGVSADRGDAGQMLAVGTDAPTQRWASTLTADRAVTLGTGTAVNGDRFRIVRTGGGAFNLNVGTGPLKALATNQWCDVEYDGSAWVLTAFGSL